LSVSILTAGMKISRSAHRPRSHRHSRAVFSLVLASLLALAVLLACDQKSGRGGKQGGGGGNGEGDSDVVEEKVPVEVSDVKSGDVTEAVQANSTWQSHRTLVLVAKTPGQLVELPIVEGQWVEANATLARSSNPELALAVERANAQLKRVQAEADRLSPLLKKGYIARAEYDRAMAEVEIAAGELRRVRSAASDVTLKAPFAGVITHVHVELGAELAPNTPIATLVDPDDLEAIVQIPERDLGRLVVGQKAELTSEAYAGQVYPATVSAIAPVVDPTTATVKVTVTLDTSAKATSVPGSEPIPIADADERRTLRPGMFVSVRIVTATRNGVKLVPKRALLFEETRAYVFRVVDGVAERVWVETGLAQGDSMEVVSGLELGNPVVTLGQNVLKGGTPVKIVRKDGEPVVEDVSEQIHATTEGN